MQIALAVEAHKAQEAVFVPVAIDWNEWSRSIGIAGRYQPVRAPIYAMSGGTLIVLAADEIVLGEFSVLGPIDP